MQGVREISLYLYGPITNIGPAWGEHPETLAQVAECTREVAKCEDLLAASALRPTRAAMLIANTSDLMQVQGLYFTAERQHLYLALKHSYLPVDLICEQEVVEDRILDRYDLLYLSDPQVRADVQQEISDWVWKGGRLWAGLGAAGWDEYSQPCPLLNGTLGVGERTMVTQPNWPRQTTGAFWRTGIGKFDFQAVGTLDTSEGKSLDLSVSGTTGQITAWGAKLAAAPTTGEVLATYGDGSPAVVFNRYGKGETLLVGLLAGEAYVRAHWPLDRPPEGGTEALPLQAGTPERRLVTALADRAGLRRPVVLSVPGVYAAVWDGPRSRAIFLNNASGRPLERVTVRLKEPGKVKQVESAQQGPLEWDVQAGELVVTLPLPDADLVAVRW
jgi:hypothetical protein